MKRTITLTLLALAATVLICGSAGAFDFGDVAFWVGNGSNQAMLIIDWNDGKNPETLAWGYRWNGNATGEDMIKAVIAADDRLNGVPSGTGVTFYVSNIGYDLNNNMSFVDTADHTTGSEWWGYYNKDGADWSQPMFGAGSRTLQNNSWDGWSLTVGRVWPPIAPGTPMAAVPEPGSLLALASGLISLSGLMLRRRTS